MTEVTALRGAGIGLWSAPESETVPVHSVRVLTALVSGWRDYGAVARLHQPESGREVKVTALGEDGWVLDIRHSRMHQGNWPCFRTVERVIDDGQASGQWYMPDPSTDLAGSMYFSHQIQFEPASIARTAAAWLSAGQLPDGFAAHKGRFDSIALASVKEAVDLVKTSNAKAWPERASRAASELGDELKVDRVVLTSPSQILLRVPGIRQRVRIQRRGEGADEHVLVIGMFDELGREFTMRLPDREVIRVSRRRPRT